VAGVPARPTHGLVEDQGDHAAMYDALPALVAIGHLVLGHGLVAAVLEHHLEAVRVARPAAEAASVVDDLHAV
jgi:hypothetical protein